MVGARAIHMYVCMYVCALVPVDVVLWLRLVALHDRLHELADHRCNWILVPPGLYPYCVIT
jgi:hypothetical protein